MTFQDLMKYFDLESLMNVIDSLGLYWILLAYVLTLMTWVFYLAVMRLIPYRHKLHPVAKFNAYVVLTIGLLLDLALNCLVATIIFMQPPHYKRLLLTARLDHLTKTDNGWRGKLASWTCEHLLNQFDPTGTHCGKEK